MLDAQGSTEGIVKDDGTTAAAYSYTDFGDTTATVTSSFGMKLSSIKSTTSKYRLQLWKGLYGKMYGHGVSSGCEIGLYYRSGKGKFWHCAYQKSLKNNQNHKAIALVAQ